MGIDGLLPALKPATASSHISNFSNKKAAIDAMGWLYRGAYSCAFELATKKPTNNYLAFIYRMLGLLKRWSITPIFCIDGRQVNAKEKTMQYRKGRKKREKEKGFDLLKSGEVLEAKKAFTKCLSITKVMIYRLVDMLRSLNVEFLIAPYEADAQVAFLCRSGYADFAVSEDSDLLCYNCPITVFKLGLLGECEVIDMQDLRQRRLKKEKLGYDHLDTLFSLSEANFTYACILAGCDYIPSVKGMGLKKALKYFERFSSVESIIRRMRVEKQFMGKVPDEYERAVKKVGDIFFYQLVYDPVNKNMVTLNEHQNARVFVQENKNFVGDWINHIEEFATGVRDIKTLEPRTPETLNVQDMFGLTKKKKEGNSQDSFIDSQRLTEMTVAEMRRNPIFSQPVPKSNNRNGGYADKKGRPASQKVEASYTFDKPTTENDLWEDEQMLFAAFGESGFGEEEEKYKQEKKSDVPHVHFDHNNDGIEEQIDFLFDICKEFSRGFNNLEEEKDQVESDKENWNPPLESIKEVPEKPSTYQPSPLKDLFGPKEEKLVDSFKKIKLMSQSQKPQKESVKKEEIYEEQKDTVESVKGIEKESHKRKFGDMESQATQESVKSRESPGKMKSETGKESKKKEGLKKTKISPPETKDQPKISLFFTKPKVVEG